MSRFIRFVGLVIVFLVFSFLFVSFFGKNVSDEDISVNEDEDIQNVSYENGLSCDASEVKSLLIEELNSEQYLSSATTLALLGVKGVNTSKVRFHEVVSVQKLGENQIMTACQATVTRTDGKSVDVGFVAEWRNKDDDTFFVHAESLVALRNQWGSASDEKTSIADSDVEQKVEESKPAVTANEIESAYNFSRFDENELDRCLASGDTRIDYYDCYEQETNLEEKRFQKLKQVAEKVVDFDISQIQKIERKMRLESNKCAQDADEREAETGNTDRVDQAACVLGAQQKSTLELKKILLSHV